MQEVRNSGIWSSGIKNHSRKHDSKIKPTAWKIHSKSYKIMKKSIKIDEKSIQNEVWDPSGSAPDAESTPSRCQIRCASAASTIWTTFSRSKINQKSIKILIKFYIKFWKAFLMDFDGFWIYFWSFFSSKWLSKSKKAILWKTLKTFRKTIVLQDLRHVFSTQNP